MIPYRDRNPSSSFPVVTLLLILVNVIAFLFELTRGERELEQLLATFGAVPRQLSLGLRGHPGAGLGYFVTLFTAMFLHGGWLHIIGNMWYLWIFSDNIEDRLGHGRFLIFYLLCGVLATLTHTIANLHSTVPMVGASGAIAGVLGAYLVLFPRARILTLVPIFFIIQIVELPAVVLLGVWFLIQLLNQLMTPAGGASGVAWMAHIGGFVAGIVLITLFPRRRGYRARTR